MKKTWNSPAVCELTISATETFNTQSNVDALGCWNWGWQPPCKPGKPSKPGKPEEPTEPEVPTDKLS